MVAPEGTYLKVLEAEDERAAGLLHRSAGARNQAPTVWMQLLLTTLMLYCTSHEQ